MKKILGILCFSMFFSFQAHAQVLEAKVNRDPIPQGEAFILSLTLDGAQTNMSPDVSVLEKDFKVYSITQSTNIKIVNGRRSENQQWNIGLIANRAGSIEIPAIQLGNIASSPLTVHIVDANQALQSASSASENLPKFSIKGQIDNSSPFVQQQINYTLSVYDTGGLQGQEPQFITGGQNDWIIKNTASPTVESKVINGKTIREIKFYYALFPQKSGVLQTPRVRFNGYYLTKGKRGYDPFEDLFNTGLSGSGFSFSDMFATRNPISLVAEPITVNVQAIPAANNGNWWLPAQKVELFSEWEPQNPIFKVGEAVNRTVYLKATGVIDTQLPNIKFADVAGIKQYPEKPVSEMAVDNHKIVAIKKIADVYIPNQTGKVTIPTVQVPWFNVATQKMETAALPAMTVNILPGAEPEAETVATAPAPVVQDSNEINNAAPLSQNTVTPESQNWTYLWAGLAFILGLAISYLLFRPKKQSSCEGKETIKDYKKYIIAKASDKDFRALRDALIEWTAQQNPQEKVNNLKDVIRLIPNPDFEVEVARLMEALYSNNNNDWNADKFIETFKKVYPLNHKEKSSEEILPKLYKD